LNICVIIPTYNEKDNITPLVQQILALECNIQVVIIDDNSPDGTGQIVDTLAMQNSQVKVIHRPGKLGLGTAHIDGFKYSLTTNADIIITMDADFSHDPSYIPSLLQASHDFQVIIGSRYTAQGGVVNWNWHRRLLSWGANLVTQLALGLKAKDCTSGFRCYHREVITNIIDSYRIFSDGYSFLVEILFKSQQHGFTIGEVPIIFVNRKLGQSKISQQEIYKAIYTVTRLAVIRISI